MPLPDVYPNVKNRDSVQLDYCLFGAKFQNVYIRINDHSSPSMMKGKTFDQPGCFVGFYPCQTMMQQGNQAEP